MAKRFTATTKWADPWFCSLPNSMKLFWIYLLDNCSHAGIWEPNWPLVEFHLHVKKDSLELSEIYNRIVFLETGKWFLPKFIEFQYGELNPENRAHQSVIHALQKEGASKELISPIQGAKDKDKDKESLPLREKKKETFEQFKIFWSAYPKRIGKGAAERAWKNLNPDEVLLKRILDAIQAQKKSDSWFKDEGKYIPYPATWLNQRRWEDEFTATNSRPRSGFDKIVGRSYVEVRKEPSMGGLPEL